MDRVSHSICHLWPCEDGICRHHPELRMGSDTLCTLYQCWLARCCPTSQHPSPRPGCCKRGPSTDPCAQPMTQPALCTAAHVARCLLLPMDGASPFMNCGKGLLGNVGASGKATELPPSRLMAPVCCRSCSRWRDSWLNCSLCARHFPSSSRTLPCTAETWTHSQQRACESVQYVCACGVCLIVCTCVCRRGVLCHHLCARAGFLRVHLCMHACVAGGYL